MRCRLPSLPLRRLAAPLPLALGLALALAAAPARPQTATLVRDLENTPGPSPSCDSCPPVDASSSPGAMVTLGSRVVFAATEPSAGTELWVTDGTATGTRMLADSCPGACAGIEQGFGRFGNSSLWRASQTLWRSDGTRAGTGPVLVEGEPLVFTYEFSEDFNDELVTASMGGRFFFNACNAARGCGVWASDGTAAGTLLLAPAPEETQFSRLRAGTSKVFFRHQGNATLWVSDGTPAGTRVVGPLPGGRFFTTAGDRLFFVGFQEGEELWSAGAAPGSLVKLTDFAAEEPFDDTKGLRAIGGRVYFEADDVLHGHELWRSDGTVAGTTRLTDFGFYDALTGLEPDRVQELGGAILFPATDGLTSTRLWRSDGDPASVRPLADFAPPSQQVRMGQRLIFVLGFNVWATDGTTAGTLSLTDLRCCGTPELGDFTLPGQLFFTAGGAVWRTDGTPAGTRPYTDRTFDAVRQPQTRLGGELLFAARDKEYGEELWASNGRRGGTRLVANVAAGPPGLGSEPAQLTAAGSRVIFTATSSAGRGLWGSAGTAESTESLAQLFAFPAFCRDCTISTAVTAGGLAFVRAENGSTPPGRLFRTDGTAAGTLQVFQAGDGQSLGGLAAVGERAFFDVATPGGARVWTSDGTVAGTHQALAFDGSYVEDLFAAGSTLYVVSLKNNRYTLWASDGTAAGTRVALEVPESVAFANGGFPLPFGRAGAFTYFFLHSFDIGIELWKTDGTAAGTARVATVGDDYYSGIGEVAEHQGALYFTILPDFGGEAALWRSDGTAAGTAPVLTLPDDEPFDSQPVPPLGLTSFGGRLYFALDDLVHGRELWASDGTPGGTALLYDVNPGAPSGEVSGLKAAGGRLFFAAADPLHGIELWQSDGTAAGTRRVQDIAPEGASSSPAGLTAAGDRLFFSADDGVHGRELWQLPLSGPAGCQPAPSRLCLGGGRFAVETEWRDFQGNRGAGRAAALTADTGTFWFFDPANVEVVVKVLDGRGLNDHFWVFFGALSSVEYSLTVTDTQTGLSRRYFNPSGRLASIADTQGFGPLGAYSSTTLTTASAPALVSARTEPAAATGVCTPGPTRLCLNGGRFAVEARWKDFQAHEGTGKAVALTGDTGYFWFFNQENVEVVLKVLDGRPVNGKFWIFYGALSSVEYTLTVTDVETGATRIYTNPAGRLASNADAGAF